MNASGCRKEEEAVGKGVVVVDVGPSARFKFYMVDRPAPSNRLRAAEIALEVSITFERPVHTVWPIFKDFNLWMSRFGYVWDAGVPADNEDDVVYLSNRPGANDVPWEDGARVKYIVRKVVPERLIYFDSLPAPIANKDGVWTGHNVISLYEENKQTKIVIFMEHTWYSETMSIEELRAEAKGELDGGLGFWRDYFIPDLISAVGSNSGTLPSV